MSSITDKYGGINYTLVREPYFELYIAGKKLSDSKLQFVEQVEYEDHATGSDICSVTIADPKYEFISDPKIAASSSFKLIGGYRLKKREMINGFISAVDYDFTEDNTPLVTIHAMDKTHKMDRIIKKRSWNKKSYYQVVQIIAREYGLGFKGKPNKQAKKIQDTVSQSGETDIQFLMDIADECEMIVYVKGNTLYFTERNYSADPQTSLYYRQPPFTLIEFSPRLVQKDIPLEETDDDIDSKSGKKSKGKATTTTPRKSTSKGSKGKNYSDLDQENSDALVYYDGDLHFRD